MTDYWIFYRSQEEGINTGPVITWGYRSSSRGETVLLDMHPLTNPGAEWVDAALGPGETFLDSAAGISVQVTGVQNGVVTVALQVASSAIDNLPVIGMIEPSQSTTLRGSVTFEVTAYDPDAGAVNGAGITSVQAALTALGSPDGSPALLSHSVSGSPPYRWTWDTSSLSDGMYVLVATAIDAQGQGNSGTFMLLMDNSGPSF